MTRDPPPTTRMLIAVITVVAIAVAGCSGGLSATSQVTSTLKAYLAGLANGNGSAACNQLTAAAAQQLVQAASSLGAPTCPRAVHEAAGYLSAADKQTLRRAKVTNVRVAANRATAAVQGGTQTADLTKIGARWLITGGFSR